MKKTLGFLLFATLTACQGPAGDQGQVGAIGDKGDKGDKGDPGPGTTPALAALTPSTMFLGRTTVMQLSGVSTHFQSSSSVVFDDPAIDIDQPWLDQYEMEVYLRFKIIRLGYRHGEVPCTKIYPPKKLGITKMKPITGWWSILRPIFLLGFGIMK